MPATAALARCRRRARARRVVARARSLIYPEGREGGPLMRAAVMRDRALVVADVPVPEPGPGEVLVRTLACGICGSDLHALKHAEQFVETSRRAGNAFVMDLARDVVMGHEFCAEIADHGPGTGRALPVGTRVTSRPVLMRPTGPQTIGYSNDHPGGYGEFMRLTESRLF